MSGPPGNMEKGVFGTFTWRCGARCPEICLQAVSLGLCTEVIGAFDDKAVKKVINLEADEWPLYLVPVGRPVY